MNIEYSKECYERLTEKMNRSTSFPTVAEQGGCIIMIGDRVTMNYMAMGYHYETVDTRHRESMPLIFEKPEDAYSYVMNVINIAKYYADKIKNSVNHSKAINDAKYELEKITSTNKSIIIPLIYDLLYHTGKHKNVNGFYDYNYFLVGLDYMRNNIANYEAKLKKEEEEKA